MSSLGTSIATKNFAAGRLDGLTAGREEGIEEGILSSIKNLMSFMAFSAEQAMKALGVPDSDYQKYLKKLQ